MKASHAFLGISILGTWGLTSISLIAGGIIMIFFPGDAETASSNVFGGIVLVVLGVGTGGLMQLIAGPMIGMDPPLPIKAKSIIPASKMKTWAKAGALGEFRDGMPTEVRVQSVRVLIVRKGDEVSALSAVCPHARLPLASFPGMPLKAEPVRDDCVTCPFHGARFEVDTGKVVRQPFTSEFNAEHPFLGRLQSKLLFFNKGSEDIQTYPAKVEDGQVMVHLPR